MNYKKELPMRYYKPNKNRTLQEEYDNLAKGSYVYAPQKIDGNWARIIKEGSEIIIQSRSISKITKERVEYTEKLPHICEELSSLPDFCFIGEVHTEELSSSKTVRTFLGCLVEKSLNRQEEFGKLHLSIFDILSFGGVRLDNLGYENRYNILQAVFKALLINKQHIHLAENRKVNTLEEANKIFKEVVSNGGEGLVLMNPKAPYHFGKSAKRGYTLKLKVNEEADLYCSGFYPPTVEYTGKHLDSWEYYDDDGNPITKAAYHKWPAGALAFSALNEDGEDIEICRVSGITDDMKKHPEKYMDKVFRINYFSFDKDRLTLREPKITSIHEDKNAEECLLSDLS